MKKLILFGFVATLVITGCTNSGSGELVGVQQREKWFEPDPYGMVKIPTGSFVVGAQDEDITFSMNTQAKTISVDAFWMDETEITNNEYREFVHYVKDSMIREKLGEEYDAEEFLIEEDEYGNPIEPPFLNWDARINPRQEEVAEVIDQFFIPENERFFRRKELDTRKFIYQYQDIDYKAAAAEKRNPQRKIMNSDGTETFYEDEELISDRSQFVKTYRLNIYPDTLAWISDFTYSYNDPLTKMYFWHPGFDDYPVVGVTWEQAKAFAIYRSEKLNNQLSKDNSGAFVQNFRLPTEHEWEYASRGGRNLTMYPWGGPYTTDDKGCFLANFKPRRGNYVDDGFIKPSPVGSYESNDYGLYDMSGNVAEWTNSAFDESTYSFTHDMNPNYEYNALPDEPAVMKRKVIRGGSWKDIAYYLQTGSRSYEYQDSAKSFIGFRLVRSTMGIEN